MMPAAATPTDAELLRRYADERSEAAFAELVRRHLDLVHSAALRQVGGNSAAAADIAQGVFTELARQASRLARHPALVGWLYTTTHRLAVRQVRDESRRQRREREAHAMQESHRSTDPEADWSRLAPVLDEAMHELAEADRVALLLRHFEHRPFADVGARLGLSENAARMRVDRALDKLRAKLAKRGVTSTSTALAVALAGTAVAAAPATLASSITTAALAATATATSTFGILSVMASTKLKVTTITAVLAAAGTALVLQHQAGNQLRADNTDLQRRVAQLTEEAQAARRTSARHADELADLRQSQAELLRLRGEVSALRRAAHPPQATVGKLKPTATTADVPPATGSFLPAETWANVGDATPEDALQSFFWRVRQGRHDELADAIKWDVNWRKEGDAAERELVEKSITDYMDLMKRVQGSLQSFRVSRVLEAGDDSRRVFFDTQAGGQEASDSNLEMRLVDGRWKPTLRLGWQKVGEKEVFFTSAVFGPKIDLADQTPPP